MTINNCPVCNNTSFEKHLTCKDFTVSKEKFDLLKCQSCSFVFTNPRPDNSLLGNYYKSEDYISHSNTKKGMISKLYHAVRTYTLGKKVDLISKYVSRGTILDYGCGTGMFLQECKKAGWKAVGMEPDAGARQIASGMGLEVLADKNGVDGHEVKKFDIITLWHVLEHVTDLDETLQFFKEKLNPGGALIIAVPNYKSFDAEHYKEFWAAYDVPRHLYHFELKTMERLLSRFGFHLRETLPMKFDSFYVSMLSEKYQTGRINYFKAFKSGLRSNLKARSANQYSSVIYVFKSA
jgi:2-polyprenyl-3-methyl-5-hydroxy-6-metoxy-1,4-benzoquinol methylase